MRRARARLSAGLPLVQQVAGMAPLLPAAGSAMADAEPYRFIRSALASFFFLAGRRAIFLLALIWMTARVES